MKTKTTEAAKGSESGTIDLLCGCSGCPVKGAMCGYVTVGGKYCKAPTNYECYYKKIDEINNSLNTVGNILDDAKEKDPEFYKELKECLDT